MVIIPKALLIPAPISVYILNSKTTRSKVPQIKANSLYVAANLKYRMI